MKRLILTLLVVTISFSLSSCFFGNLKSLNIDRDEYYANIRMEQLFKILSNKDKDGLKGLFSKKVLSEISNFDKTIDSLFSFIIGKPVSWDLYEADVVFDKSDDKGNSKRISNLFSFDTDKQKYKIFLIDYPIDTIDPENCGLYSIRIYKTEENEFYYKAVTHDDLDYSGIRVFG